MLNIPLPIYVAFFFFLGASFLLNLHQRYQKRQRELPERERYLADLGRQEPVCKSCDSANISEIGLLHGEDDTRVVSCADCKTMLYQFKRDPKPDEDEDDA